LIKYILRYPIHINVYSERSTGIFSRQKSMETAARNNAFDYAKSLAMILVVMIHVGFSQVSDIILFAMPLFFILPGYFYKPGKRTWKQEVWHDFQHLIVPFIIYMFLYMLIEMIRAPYFGYGTPMQALKCSLANILWGSGILPGIFVNGGVMQDASIFVKGSGYILMPMNSHMWFLPALFIGKTIFSLIENRLKSDRVRIPVIIALVFTASLETLFPKTIQWPWGLSRGIMAAAWMLGGVLLKKYSVTGKSRMGKKVPITILSLGIYAVATVLHSDGVSMSVSYYGPYGIASVFLTYLGGTAGAIAISNILGLLDGIRSERIRNALAYPGKHSLEIYMWHIVVKFILDIVYKGILGRTPGLDMYKLGLLPGEAFGIMAADVVIIMAVCILGCMAKDRYTESHPGKRIPAILL
jgi:fucose 4-O-acetylase-like acetyltransferase